MRVSGWRYAAAVALVAGAACLTGCCKDYVGTPVALAAPDSVQAGLSCIVEGIGGGTLRVVQTDDTTFVATSISRDCRSGSYLIGMPAPPPWPSEVTIARAPLGRFHLRNTEIPPLDLTIVGTLTAPTEAGDMLRVRLVPRVGALLDSVRLVVYADDSQTPRLVFSAISSSGETSAAGLCGLLSSGVHELRDAHSFSPLFFDRPTPCTASMTLVAHYPW